MIGEADDRRVFEEGRRSVKQRLLIGSAVVCFAASRDTLTELLLFTRQNAAELSELPHQDSVFTPASYTVQ